MSIQPVNKAVEHLISSTPVLEREKKRAHTKKAFSSCLINNSKGEWGGGGEGQGGGGHSHKQSEGLGGEREGDGQIETETQR